MTPSGPATGTVLALVSAAGGCGSWALLPEAWLDKAIGAPRETGWAPPSPLLSSGFPSPLPHVPPLPSPAGLPRSPTTTSCTSASAGSMASWAEAATGARLPRSCCTSTARRRAAKTALSWCGRVRPLWATTPSPSGRPWGAPHDPVPARGQTWARSPLGGEGQAPACAAECQCQRLRWGGGWGAWVPVAGTLPLVRQGARLCSKRRQRGARSGFAAAGYRTRRPTAFPCRERLRALSSQMQAKVKWQKTGRQQDPAGSSCLPQTVLVLSGSFSPSLMRDPALPYASPTFTRSQSEPGPRGHVMLLCTLPQPL